jgi:uncharacterized protein YlxW (UPF0749 family)
MADVPTTEPGTGRRDASMVLLTNLIEDSLDQGYARAAARRSAGDDPGPRRPWVLPVGLLAVGLLLATAAAQTRDRASAVAEARTALVAEIDDRERANERLQRTLDRRREAVAAARRDALRVSEEGLQLARTLAELEAVTGAGPVTGPGMTITLADAPSGEDDSDEDPRGDADDGRVSDRDLQTVVNEVWAAGAEAVSVNGARLTALSAIRAAGEAILVDYRPLNPPYEIEAIGAPEMRTRFAEGFGGSYVRVLQDYGITSEVSSADELRLPASAGVTLRYATTTGDVPSGSTRSGSTEGRGGTS